MRNIPIAGLVLALLVGLFQPLAAGPDDQFVNIYNVLQEADGLRDTGRPLEACARYEQAHAALLKLQAEYPNWNPKIINFRLNYIADRIGPPPATPATPSAPAPTPAQTPSVAATPSALQSQQIAALETEIKNLTNERNLLQAKLREALAVQPAAVDPRELAKAGQRLKEVEAENDRLRKDLGRQQQKLARAADPAVLEAAQKALKEAQESLARQTNAVARLNLEKAVLQQELRIQTDRARAKATREQAKVAQRQPPTRVAPSTPTPAAPAISTDARVAELTRKLSEMQRALGAEQSRSDLLRTEKTALEKRVAELAKPRETAPTAASTAPAPKPVSTKMAKAVEKEKIRLLERERNDLRKRVNALTRELEDRRVPKSAAAKEQLTEELSILRARVQVYEARQVPYTAEEMALFKQAASTPGKNETAITRKSSRQLPASAAALVAEAQRAVQARRFEEAEQKFRQALSYDEKNIVLLDSLAATYLDANRLNEAEPVLKRALAVDPNDPQSLALQGLLRFRQAKYDEALDILGRAAQLDPDNALTQNYLGVTLSQKGQREPAETALRRAVQLDVNYAEAHQNLAVVYATQKPPFLELARWHYQKALAAGQPKNADLEKLLQITPAAGGSK